MMAEFNLTVPADKFMWALGVLIEAHTHDDPQTGFVVDMGALPPTWISSHDYVEAWTIVRKAMHRNVNPSPTPAE